jgi:hypothetical protein
MKLIKRKYWCYKCELLFEQMIENKHGYELQCPKCKRYTLLIYSYYKKLQRERKNGIYTDRDKQNRS